MAADERLDAPNGRSLHRPQDAEQGRAEPTKVATQRRLGWRRPAIVAAALAVVGLVFVWWLYARRFEDTDDAQIDGNIGAISPRVPGSVTQVFVVDFQAVKEGDLLVQLDATDLVVSVAQARAAVAQAQAAYEAESPTVAITQTSTRASVEAAQDDVDNARADLAAAQRDLDQAQAQARLAELQLERGRLLLASNTIPQADFDQRAAAADVARASVESARQRVEQRRARLATAETRLAEAKQNAPRQIVVREANLQTRKANLELAQAQLRQAELNVSYAKVVAPVAGIVGRKSVNVGDRVQPGQQLMALTQTGDLWVTANFRETQIEHMQAGQKASIHVDALGRDYQGTIESFAGATGSKYSILPPENATGNYVKVVQRLPVRIRFDEKQPDMERLRPGMSVEPKVKVR
jgi:membrane fusion protein (multidrug efflux system)